MVWVPGPVSPAIMYKARMYMQLYPIFYRAAISFLSVFLVSQEIFKDDLIRLRRRIAERLRAAKLMDPLLE